MQKPAQKRRLARKILIPSCLASLILTAFLGVFVYLQVSSIVNDVINSKVSSMATFIALAGQQRLYQMDFEALKEYIEPALRDSDLESLNFFDETGKDLFPNSGRATQKNNVFKEKRPLKDPEGHQIGVLELGYNTDTAAAASRKILTILVGFFAFMEIMLSISLYLIVKKAVLKPMEKTVQFSARVKEGDLQERLNLDSDDEIGVMAGSLDTMADNLAAQSQTADEISKGNLDVNIKLASANDTLGQALQRMTESLKQIISQANSTAGKVATGTTSITRTSRNLAAGAHSQANSIQKISQSMTQVSSKTAANADRARQVESLAQAAQAFAKNGYAKMESMIQAMSNIEISSKEIEKINKVIDDIAFQTNLLALNAAVEAARAGKHGKGFAVVAGEVRSLAGRSTHAAQETSTLITESMNRVIEGKKVAEDTIGVLKEIVQSTAGVNNLVSEIVLASSDQTSVIDSVSKELREISGVTQLTASNAENAAINAETLKAEAESLSDILRKFRMSDPEPIKLKNVA